MKMEQAPGDEEDVSKGQCECDLCYQDIPGVKKDSVLEKSQDQTKQPNQPVYGNRPWAQTEAARLREIFVIGQSLEAMSDLLGRSQNAVLMKLVNLGLISEVDLSNVVHQKQQRFKNGKISKTGITVSSSTSKVIQAVVVANSYKHLGRCLAVIDLQTSELLRPVFDDIHRELPEVYTQVFDGSGVRPLKPGDFVMIPLNGEDSTFWQRENWFVDAGQKIKLITGNLDHLKQRAKDASKGNYSNPDLILSTPGVSIPSSEISRGNASLELRFVTNVKIFDRLRANGKKGLRVEFDYKGQTFSFAFTDENTYLGHGSKVDRAMVCLSLGEAINGKHYKLVAGLMPVASP